VCFIVMACSDPVTSCYNIRINHSFPTSFISYQEIKFSARKLKEYYPHQSAEPKNYADLHLQEDASTDRTSLPVTEVYNYTSGSTACLAVLLLPGYWSAGASKLQFNQKSLAPPSYLSYAICFATYVANVLRMDQFGSKKCYKTKPN